MARKGYTADVFVQRLRDGDKVYVAYGIVRVEGEYTEYDDPFEPYGGSNTPTFEADKVEIRSIGVYENKDGKIDTRMLDEYPDFINEAVKNAAVRLYEHDNVQLEAV